MSPAALVQPIRSPSFGVGADQRSETSRGPVTKREPGHIAARCSLSDTVCVVVTHQTGLTVAEVTELRRQMRAAGASFKVTKNRLARRALAGTKFEQLSPLFKGPTAIAYSQDPVAAAKVAVEFANKNDKLTHHRGRPR